MSSTCDQKSEPEDQPGNNGWASPGRVQTVVLIAAIAFGIYLCYRMALPFLPALTWAGALAILFAPLHRWLESKLRRANLAAAVSVLLVALIVVVPATFMAPSPQWPCLAPSAWKTCQYRGALLPASRVKKPLIKVGLAGHRHG